MPAPALPTMPPFNIPRTYTQACTDTNKRQINKQPTQTQNTHLRLHVPLKRTHAYSFTRANIHTCSNPNSLMAYRLMNMHMQQENPLKSSY